jgi:DNA-binding Xre family transcriptional regulator
MPALTLEWRLSELCARKQLRPSDLWRALLQREVTMSRQAAYRLVTREQRRITLATLAALCEILDCTPNDLLALHRDAPTGTARVPEPPAFRLDR